MKRPSWLRGEPDEPKAEDAKATKAPAKASEETEKVSVPFGKAPKAKAAPPAKAKADKPKVEKAKVEKPRKAKADKPKVERAKPKKDKDKATASERAEKRKLAKASKPKAAVATKSIAKKVAEAEKTKKPAKPRRPIRGKKPVEAEAPKKAKPTTKDEKRPRRAKAAAATSAVGSQLKDGTDETRKRTRSVAPEIGKGLLKGAGAVFAIFFSVLGFFLGILLAVGAFVAGPGRAVLGRIRKIVDALSRQLTPARALAIVVAGAAVLLALSQFADYRSVSIGTDAYSGVETVAPAPEIERVATGEAHSYVFVPVAAAALLLLPFALRGRWRLCRLIALGGVAAVIVGLVVDRPAGLDPGEAALAFDGVKGTLLGGFYAELFAGALLAVSAMLLARELRAEVAAKPVREARSPRKKQRLRLPRPRPGGKSEEAPA